MKLIKCILKCAILLFLLVFFQSVLVSWVMGLTAGPLSDLGDTGVLIMLFLLSVLSPVISVVLVIGVLGAVWIGGKRQIGFTLATVVSLIYLVALATRQTISFDIRGFIILLGIPAVILSGGLTYGKVCKFKMKKMAQPGVDKLQEE